VENSERLPIPKPHRIVKGMASNRPELAALKNMIAEADLILETIPTLPENRTARCHELLKSAPH
jgi:hypothetical protein